MAFAAQGFARAAHTSRFTNADERRVMLSERVS